MNDENHSWGAGGIFGQGAEDALEVLDEMSDGPFPDGNGGFRTKPSLMNRLGAEDAISRRRWKEAKRREMLVIERFFDEWPELRDKLLDRFGPNGLREKLLDRLIPQQTFMVAKPETVREALGARIMEASIETTAEIFSRAYKRDIQRAQAAVRLGAFEPEDWARAQTQKILTAPTTAARAVLARARALVARMRHVSNAMTESLEKPEPTEPPPSEEQEENDDHPF